MMPAPMIPRASGAAEVGMRGSVRRFGMTGRAARPVAGFRARAGAGKAAGLLNLG